MDTTNTRKHGLQVRARPGEYEATPTQIRVKKAAEHCGIKKGMTRADLMKAMKECIPQYYRDLKEGKVNGETGD